MLSLDHGYRFVCVFSHVKTVEGWIGLEMAGWFSFACLFVAFFLHLFRILDEDRPQRPTAGELLSIGRRNQIDMIQSIG